MNDLVLNFTKEKLMNADIMLKCIIAKIILDSILISQAQ